jgi:hypothetical protein
MDYNVIPDKCVVSQHNLMVDDFHFYVHVQRDRRVKIMRMKWCNFTEETSKVFKDKVIAEGSWNISEDVNIM